MKTQSITVGAALLFAANVAGGITSCAEPPCREPSEACECPRDASGSASLVLMTDERSEAFSEAVARLAMPNAKGLRDGVVGLDSAPVVIVVTYDDLGNLHEVGSFNLAGTGSTSDRKAANAELAAACLLEAASAVAADAPAGNLLRALPSASDLAAARSSGEAAVIAFGLGRSALDDPTMDRALPLAEIDLSTPEAQQHVVDVLRQIGLAPVSDGVAITLFDPSEGVVNLVSAGLLWDFAVGPLCEGLAGKNCRALKVLP